MMRKTLWILALSAPLSAQVVNPGGGSGSGCSTGTTTNLISGNGSGGCSDSAIAASNVVTLSGTQTATGTKTFSAPLTVNSTAATSGTVPTFSLLDSEAAATNMFVGNFLAPNMANGNIANYFFGQALTSNNAFALTYTRTGASLNSNRLSLQIFGQPVAFTLFGKNNVAEGSGTPVDAGFRLDVVGTLRAQTSTTSPSYLTPNSFVGRSQTGALNQTILASANTAMYRISLASNCRTAVGATGYTATVSYTDTSNTVQTIASTAISCSTLGVTSFFNQVSVANVLTGTSISLATTTTGAVSYDVAVTAEQVSSN